MDNFGFGFMTRTERTSQRGVCHFYGKVDGSAVAGGTAVTDGLSTGFADKFTVTENGNGDYTFTLNVPGERFLSIQVTSITDDAVCTAALVSDGTSFRVKQTTAASGAALADADFYVDVAVQYAADET
jgi:hypothetical protein